MKRRAFLGLLGGLAVATVASEPVGAQSSPKRPAAGSTPATGATYAPIEDGISFEWSHDGDSGGAWQEFSAPIDNEAWMRLLGDSIREQQERLLTDFLRHR